MRVDEQTELTVVAAPRAADTRVALWRAPGDADDSGDADGAGRDDADRSGRATTPVRLGLADGFADVPAQLVALPDAIGPLATLPASAPCRPSVRALSVATRLALGLIARGRLLPAVDEAGRDTWRLGPLDPDDLRRIEALADALPAAVLAHAVDPDTDRMTATPAAVTTRFLDAVADAFVRTASAPEVAGSIAFAHPSDATDVSAVESWLQSVTAGTAGDTVPGLRIVLPAGHDAAPDADKADEADGAADPAEHGGVDDPMASPVQAILQVQSRLDPSLVLDAADLWQAPPAVLARFGPDVETDLLLTLRRAARVWPPAERLLAEAAPDSLDLADAEVEELFGPVADDLAAAGLPVLWPAEVFRPVEMRPVVDTPAPDGVSGGRLDLSALGEIRWHATVDGADLTEAELLALAQAKRPMVRLRGRWVRADPARLRRLQERKSVSAGDVLSTALTGSVALDGQPIRAELSPALLELAQRLASIDKTTARDAPDSLQAELRPYQERGLAWLAEMTSLGLGGILADDMGLGKTIQVLALHLLRHDAARDPDAPDALRAGGPTLVICPATLMSNWEREAARFAPDVPVLRYHGTGRSLDGLTDEHLIVATYGIARRDAVLLDEIAWDLIVADEAQAIKNPLSRTARAMRSIDAGARLALTGTPVENRLADLWALLDWTTPGLLGPLDPFQRNVATPIEREKDPEATERLSAIVAPFLLRRRKSDPEIAPDLPPKTETDQFVGITVEQATLYKAAVDELMEDVAEASAADDGGFGRQGQVLKLLTALKQICNHPAHYLGQDGPLGSRSGKLDATTDLLSVITDEGDSALVFTQYVAMGHLLERHFDAHGISSQFLHGSLPIHTRETLVDRFQAGDPQVFIISLQAGGTGLNLTRATHVIHYDRWWNPAVEDQASDRAWRIGQDRPVQVHRMISEGTLEERIARILDDKRGLAESVVGGGEAWISQLSDRELADLVTLRHEIDDTGGRS